MKRDESLHQRAYFEWARRHPVARSAYAIPNGGRRDRITAAILKAEGVLAGVLDVFLPVPSGDAHGLYIEFKAGKNTLTTEQRDFAIRALDHGYRVVVAYDWRLALDATTEYLAGRLPPGLHTLKPARVART